MLSNVGFPPDSTDPITPPAAASGGLSPPDLAEDRRLGDEARDPHPLAATAKERIDLADATDPPCPRFRRFAPAVFHGRFPWDTQRRSSTLMVCSMYSKTESTGGSANRFSLNVIFS